MSKKPRAMGLLRAALSPPSISRGAALNLTVAQYRDAGLWRTANREWQAAYRHFINFHDELDDINVPLLVISADGTLARDPAQKDLHDDFTKRSPLAESHIIEGAAHDKIVLERSAALAVARLARCTACGMSTCSRRPTTS